MRGQPIWMLVYCLEKILESVRALKDLFKLENALIVGPSTRVQEYCVVFSSQLRCHIWGALQVIGATGAEQPWSRCVAGCRSRGGEVHCCVDISRCYLHFTQLHKQITRIRSNYQLILCSFCVGPRASHPIMSNQCHCQPQASMMAVGLLHENMRMWCPACLNRMKLFLQRQFLPWNC